MITRSRLLILLAVVATLPGLPSAHSRETRAAAPVAAALEALRESSTGRVAVRFEPTLGAYDVVRAEGRAVLVRDDANLKPEVRALRFLARHGAVVGMSDAERRLAAAHARGQTPHARVSALRPLRVEVDAAGNRHVRLEQIYRRLPVTGGQLVVHLSGRGVTGVNGTFVPGLRMDINPAASKAQAKRAALQLVQDETGEADLRAARPKLTVYRTGLVARTGGLNGLAWEVLVSGAGIEEQVWVDARDGSVLDRVSLVHHAKDRCVYTPQYDPANPDLFAARKEGQPPTAVPPVDNLYDYTGQVYDFFSNTFDRDSFDGAGHKMRTVYFVDSVCPNAFYRSATKATYYCPGFDTDDIVAHEWAHGVTHHTGNLIYAWQPGALNEAYSDIWGELIDLLNGQDGIGGTNNDEAWPNGQRWIVGEDLTEPVHDALLLRDMWNPERLGLPAKVSSTRYFCGTGDNGGVHYNSSVPNHAFAMLVDGKEFNGRTVEAIGMTKAAHIYWQAQLAYQTPTTTFAEHDQHLRAACDDLLGLPLRSVMTGDPSGQTIGSDDCEQVAEAMAAVEMSETPVQCGFQPLLAKSPPPVCGGAETLFAEDWEDGLAGWTSDSAGVDPATWPGFTWQADATLPGERHGTAAFAEDPRGGSCATGGKSNAGRYSLTSDQIAVPAGAPPVRLRLDHLVETQAGFDGGNVKLSVNGGAFNAIPAAAYTYNAPGIALPAPNPLAGQNAWHGSDGGMVTGSWGTSVADLTGIVRPGDTFKIRLDFGIDCAGGATGWFVDDLSVYACPPLPAPSARLGEDYSEPDADGSYTIGWTRPDNATGPDEVQEALVRPPRLRDDAETGFGAWDLSVEGGALGWTRTNDKPNHDSTAFFAQPNEASMAVLQSAASMTTKEQVTIPASGQTVLSFKEWNMNEPDDGVFVDVSEDGSRWRTVWTMSRSTVLADAIAARQNEPLAERTIDLTEFAGKSVKLRFRYVIGYTNYLQRTPFGWYVDDISLSNVDWQTIATTTETSHPVTGRTAGEWLYRVRTSYTFDSDVVPGDWSNTLRASVQG